MSTDKNKITVAIIGGGFAGAMNAVHLLSQNKKAVHIILINSKYPLSKGIAYSSYSNKHLLNVAAKNMSAFPDKPNHFISWIKNHDNYGALDQLELPNMYLPRNIYGHYLKDVFDNAIRKKPDNVSIEFIHDEAIDMEIINGEAKISFSVSPPVTASKVVLAMGNQMPRTPKFNNDTFHASKRYYANPWVNEAVSHPGMNGDVIIIGNGLTMVDVVFGLREKNYKGKIYSLSPHGFRILPHRRFEPYHELVQELKTPYELNTLVKLFRRHIQKLRSRGIAGEAAVDSLRPFTQKIWMALSKTEKERFMFHIRHMWGVARHRLPMDVHLQIQQMILDNSLEIIAGRIHSVEESESAVHVSIMPRNKREVFKIKADRVINCTGPESDITKTNNELIQNMLMRQLIFPDEMSLGINALPDGTILDKKGQPADNLFAIGSLIKGILWESTAVPEVRTQAKNIAEKIIGTG